MVFGLAPIRQRAACRLWHGHRALHGVDVRHRAHSRNDSFSEDAVSDQALIPAAFRSGLPPARSGISPTLNKRIEGHDKLKFVGPYWLQMPAHHQQSDLFYTGLSRIDFAGDLSLVNNQQPI